ncbi:MAG: ABC transporter permease [Acidimicrobiales bacterium]
MPTVWMIARSQLRRRRGATIVLALLVGLAGAFVIAAVAGASRTDSAMARFVAYSQPEDLIAIVNGVQGDPSDPNVVAQALATRARVLALPQIAEVDRAPYLFLSPDKAGKEIGSINPFASAGEHAFRTMDRPLVLHGRLARADRADEVVVDDFTAAQRHLRVGSELTMWSFSFEQTIDTARTGFGKIPRPAGPSYSFRVVGVMRLPNGVNSPPQAVARDANFTSQASMYLTPAFLRQYAKDQGVIAEALPGMEIFRIRLRNGLAGLPAFEQALRNVVSPGDGQVHVGSDTQDAADKAKRAIHLEALALLLFAGLAALAAALVLGQVLSRQVAADAADHPTLTALGVSRSQLALVPLVRAGIVGLTGAGAAVLGAVTLSPLALIGLARRAEIHPGVSVNIAVLGLGFVCVTIAVMARSLISARRAARLTPDGHLEREHARSGRRRATATGVGLSPSAVVGLRMSFERGRGITVRAALLGISLAVAGVVAAVTFGVSLRHLVNTPREQGWNWDVVVGNPNSQALAGDPAADSLHTEMTRLLTKNRYVGAFSGFALTDAITVDGHRVDIGGIEKVEGSVFVKVVDGRAPVTPGEIALGRDALDELHKGIGQDVTVSAGRQRVTMRIVGQSLEPTAGGLGRRLSRGGAMTLAGLRRLLSDTPVLQFAVRYEPGVDGQAAFGSLLNDFGRVVLRPYPGGEIGDLAQVDFLPYILAGFLVVMAIGALGLTLVGSIRRHRRDLAVLQTIGFVRRQVWATVAWQATALAVIAVVIGIPLGVVLGKWTWHLVASSVGSVSPPIVPLAAVLLLVPITILLANLLGGGPAWAAGGGRPAEALRTE